MAATKVSDMSGEELANLIAKAVSGGSNSNFQNRVGGGATGDVKGLIDKFGDGLTGILGHMSAFAGKAIEQTADTGHAVEMVSKTMPG
jgi:hypothetical protein